MTEDCWTDIINKYEEEFSDDEHYSVNYDDDISSDYRDSSRGVSAPIKQRNKDVATIQSIPVKIKNIVINRLLPLHSSMYAMAAGRSIFRQRRRANAIYECCITAAIMEMTYIDLAKLCEELALDSSKVKSQFSTAYKVEDSSRVIWYCMKYLIEVYDYSESDLVDRSKSLVETRSSPPPAYRETVLGRCWVTNLIISQAPTKNKDSHSIVLVLPEIRALAIVAYHLETLSDSPDYVRLVRLAKRKNHLLISKLAVEIESIYTEFTEWKKMSKRKKRSEIDR